EISVLVAGHADEIGLIVRRIDDSGVLWFGKIGGVDPAVLAGTRVRVLTRKGDAVPGVIGMPAIHLLPPKETSAKPKLDDLSIDIGAKDQKDAEKLLSVGDPVVFGEDFRELRGGFAAHRCFDNRMGCFIVAEMMRALAAKKRRAATVIGVSSVQEETGVFGAGLLGERYHPTVAIAVDVTHDTTTPGISKTAQADVACGKGPVITRGVRTSRIVSDLLEKSARAGRIPFQLEIDQGHTGTDADALSGRSTGIPVGVVSVACRYMHTPCEVIHLGDLEQAVDLLVRFVSGLSDKIDLVPR
ncbi:MAG TPA: M42 family peptidase, partial [bacterium]|nr:M42 family peptidase [bacterium]